jgi:hypothetical protein
MAKITLDSFNPLVLTHPHSHGTSPDLQMLMLVELG